MMTRPTLAALLLTALAPAAFATPAFAEVPDVVTDIPAVQSLVAQVMGDLGTPAVLLEQGGDAHSFQLKPSQAAALQAADLVVWVGPQMTPWLDRALEGTAPKGHVMALLQAAGTQLQEFGGKAHDHDAEADHDHDHEEAGHVHEGLDPHAWLNPQNAEAWLGAIAAELSAADPEHGATYAANAAAARAKVAALDAELAAQLTPLQGRPFVVFHDAYGYFAAHYGLTVAGTVAMGDAADPGAAHLAELRDALTGKGVICAFPEANHDPKQIAMLLDGTSVRLGAGLDPEGSALSYGPGLYGDLMRGLGTAISACLAP